MEASADRRYRLLVIAALALIAVAYAAQLPTPLRLHNDTIVLVSPGESPGQPFFSSGLMSTHASGFRCCR